MILLRRRIGWGLALVAITGIGLAAVSSFMLNPTARDSLAQAPSFPLHFQVMIFHILLAFVALVVGPFQFMRGLRQKYLSFHRIIGRVYLTCVFLGGITGLMVGLFTTEYTRQVAFLMLGVLWLFTATKAYLAIRKRHIEAHQAWMTRNYALTLVAIVARVIVPLSVLIQVLRGNITLPIQDFQLILDEMLGTGVWFALVLNLIVAEWIILRRKGNTRSIKTA